MSLPVTELEVKESERCKVWANIVETSLNELCDCFIW